MSSAAIKHPPGTGDVTPQGRKAQELETALRQLAEAHERLLGLVRRKRLALRRAQRDEVVELCRKENQQVTAISELEKRRLALAAELTLMVEPTAKEPLRLEALAHRLLEPARGRLLMLREALRAKMEETRREAGAARQATERLAAHMQGVIQSIGGVIAGAATYSPRAAGPAGTMNFSTFSATG